MNSITGGPLSADLPVGILVITYFRSVFSYEARVVSQLITFPFIRAAHVASRSTSIVFFYTDSIVFFALLLFVLACRFGFALMGSLYRVVSSRGGGATYCR